MLRLSKASQSTSDASASRAHTAGWHKHEHSGQKWHTKHQAVGAVNGATRLTPEISAPKGGLAAEHRLSTAFSHILAVTWRDARVNIQTTSPSIRGAGTQCGPSHPTMGQLSVSIRDKVAMICN